MKKMRSRGKKERKEREVEKNGDKNEKSKEKSGSRWKVGFWNVAELETKTENYGRA